MLSLLLGYAGILGPYVLVFVASAVVGYAVLARVDRRLAGVLLGLFLGPIGVLIAWMLRRSALRDRRELARARALAADLPTFAAPSAAPAPAVPPRSFSESLDDLVARRAAGLISDDEYQREKRALFE